ncbi:hypothetical protein BHE74_00016955 [Ensete ventricosum]|nr:hypothetical protein BHE74_00016955 [Ensete ventricosum]
MLQRRGGYLQTRTATASQAVGHPDLARRPFFLLVKPTTTARLSTRPRRRDRPLSRTSPPLSRTVGRAASDGSESKRWGGPREKRPPRRSTCGNGPPPRLLLLLPGRPYASNYAVASFLPFGTTEGDGRARRFEDRRRQHVRSSVRYLIFSPYPLLAVTPVSLTAPHLSSPLPPITGHVDAEDELV